MKESIEYVNLEEREKVITALALSLEVGFLTALEALAGQGGRASCIRIQKTNLQSMIQSSTLSISGVEIRYGRGVTGTVLLLIRRNDLFRIGAMLSPVESKVDDPIPPEILESCMQFFGNVVGAANKHFAEQYSNSVACDPPELINPDGNSGSLLPLAGSYDKALCMTFDLGAGPQFATQIDTLIQPQLVKSLIDLLPAYPLDPSGSSAAEQLRAPSPRQEGSGFDGAGGSRPTAQHRTAREPAVWNIDLILDVELPIVVSFGETQMQLKDILKLGVGSVIELQKSVNDPVTVIVNQKPIALGEVVMVDGNYGVRILEVESTAERIRTLGQSREMES